MQYPEIQFYRGSLVRLASGQLKHVEDLSSDDFIESARLAVSSPSSGGKLASFSASQQNSQHKRDQQANCNSTSQNRIRFDFNPLATSQLRRVGQSGAGGSSGQLDENNNSVFNSPEPTSSYFDDSPRMKTGDYEGDNEDEEIDVELDVVTTQEDVKHEVFNSRLHGNFGYNNQQERGLNLASRNEYHNKPLTKSSLQQQVKLEHHQHGSSSSNTTTTQFTSSGPSDRMAYEMNLNSIDRTEMDSQDFYIDSGVVRDFLEVGPIQLQTGQRLPASTSPASSTNSLNSQDHHLNHHHNNNVTQSLPSTSSSSSNSLQSSISPPVVMPQILSAASPTTSQTVLIKFFLETSRSVVFIEVPIEHPFFVFHRGWSSWNPQRTYDKFGLKCRKLKIGDTCVSLIRRKSNSPNQQQESDHCNQLFSSIKINE